MPQNGADIKLTDRERKALAGPPLANPFDAYDRLFPDFLDGDVFAYDWDVRQLKEMLGRSGKARSVEQVLTLPLRSAKWEITGSGLAADLVRANLGDKLGRVIDQATGAITYRKAFFELVWRLDSGRVVYDEIAWRPPASCEAGFDSKTGRETGFRQRISYPAAGVLAAEGKDTLPGYVRIPKSRSFIYTHGTHREPVLGISDLDVTYWCYETQQKLLFLWFQFLEKQSLPNVVVYGEDQRQADENADAVADQKAGGVIGMARPQDPTAKAFDILESSGYGADQFIQAVRYMDEMMVQSVLAGFTDLTSAATQGRGSYALSQDQSEFFLASRQAVADELADAITEGLIKPLVVYNFGADVEIPRLVIGPLSRREADRALETLRAIVSASKLNVPPEFVDELVRTTATFLGLDEKTVVAAIDRFAKRREQAAPQGTPAEVEQVGNAVRGVAGLVEEKRAA